MSAHTAVRVFGDEGGHYAEVVSETLTDGSKVYAVRVPARTDDNEWVWSVFDAESREQAETMARCINEGCVNAYTTARAVSP